MARHSTFTLDAETAAHATRIRESLMYADSYGHAVTFTVQGRDSGIITERHGMVVGFTGEPGLSNEAITVDTDKGYRTFNVWLIRSIQIGD